MLGHHVADGSNPAHTTIHHNGWIADNPRGFATDGQFHGRFESAYVQARITIGDVRPLAGAPARVFPSVRVAVLDYLDRSHGLVERLYALDRVAAFDTSNTHAEHRQFTAERLAAGTTMLRDLWYTVWVTSQEAPAVSPDSTRRPG